LDGLISSLIFEKSKRAVERHVFYIGGSENIHIAIKSPNERNGKPIPELRRWIKIAIPIIRSKPDLLQGLRVYPLTNFQLLVSGVLPGLPGIVFAFGPHTIARKATILRAIPLLSNVGTFEEIGTLAEGSVPRVLYVSG